jgi:hypothetical protein
MKKVLCIIPAVFLFVLIAAPNAHADSYSATFTCTSFYLCDVAPTASNASFPAPTDIAVSLGSYPIPIAFDLTLPAADAPTDVYRWSYGSNHYPIQGVYSGTFEITDLTTNLVDPVYLYEPNPLPYTDNIAQGYLLFSPVSAAAPEPSTVFLMLLGAGMLSATRKRSGSGPLRPA